MEANDQSTTKAQRANHLIKTKTQRLELTPRAKPYNNSIEPGRLLGYIRRSGAAGSWVVDVEVKREASGWSKRKQKTLGLADDFAEANDDNILSYRQAMIAASAWQPAQAKAGKAGAFTVADAVEAHKGFGGKKGRKSDVNKDKAYDSLRYHVLRLESDGTKRAGNLGLGAVVINDLTAEQLIALQQSWIAETSEATALRNWTNLHSCLERAAANKANRITNDVWRTPERGGQVPPMNQDFAPRLLHFSNQEALEIIERARAIDAPVADYFEALFRTGARPGVELFTLTVGDFNQQLRRISITNGKTGPRPNVSLDAHGVALFARLTSGRASSAPLLDPCEGRSRIKHVLVAAVQAVLPEVKAEDIVPYAFRHTFISRRLEAGMPVSLVAKHCGNSEYIIGKTYAKFCPSETERWLTETAPQPVLQVVKTDEPQQREQLPVAA